MTGPMPFDSREFDPTRTFRVWRYNVSHAQLLLRSTKRDTTGKRIDVLFKGVALINLPTTMTALTITGTEPIDGESRRYGLRFNGGDGYVIAVGAAFMEDDGEHDDPSVFPFSGL
jgi:hypothetical protein